MPKTPAKKTPNKSAFIRSLPADMPAADVVAKAAEGQVRPGDDEAQQDANDDQEEDQVRGTERQAAFEWPRAPLPDGVAGHR